MKYTFVRYPNSEGLDDIYFYIDGKEVGFCQPNPDARGHVIFVSMFNEIAKYNIEDFLAEGIRSVTFTGEFNSKQESLPKLTWQVCIDFHKMFGRNAPLQVNAGDIIVTSTIIPNNIFWDQNYSILNLAETLSNIVDYTEQRCFRSMIKEESSSLEFIRKEYQKDISIKSLWEAEKKWVLPWLKQANKSLASIEDPNTLKLEFNFPDEIKPACEQYLLYFTQFLADLGISANTSIDGKDESSIFKIIPKDPEQALSQIRDALTVYLNLPSIDNLNLQTNSFDDIGVQQLLANVYHLNSQLSLARAELQLKEMSIKTLNLELYQTKNLLEEKKIDDGEPLFSGLIKIKKYKGPGFEIDLPEVLRKIKRLRK